MAADCTHDLGYYVVHNITEYLKTTEWIQMLNSLVRIQPKQKYR